MSQVYIVSEVRIERVKGPVRKAYLPAEAMPVIFGVHGPIAEHYKVPPAVLDLTPRRWITSSRLPPVDLPAPSEARWKRVTSMLRIITSYPKPW